jgi:hypothetical protein
MVRQLKPPSLPPSNAYQSLPARLIGCSARNCRLGRVLGSVRPMANCAGIRARCVLPCSSWSCRWLRIGNLSSVAEFSRQFLVRWRDAAASWLKHVTCSWKFGVCVLVLLQ